MRVAEDRDVVDHVEVGTAVDVVEPLAPAALDLRRVVGEVEALRAGDGAPAAGQDGVRRLAGDGHVEAEQRSGVGADLEPCRRERGGHQAGELLELGGGQLHVHVSGQPVAGRDSADDLARAERLRLAGNEPGEPQREPALDGEQQLARSPPQHLTVHGSEHGGALRQEDVGADVDRGGLVERRAGVVDDPPLAVAAGRKLAGGELQPVAPAAGSDVVGARREIEGPDLRGVEPGGDRPAAWHARRGEARHPARGAKRRVGDGRGDRADRGELVPRVLDALVGVRVARLEDDLLLATGGAERRAGRHERGQRGQLVLGQRQRGIEAPDHLGRVLDDPVGVAAGDGDREHGALGREPRPAGVAEVEHGDRDGTAVGAAAGEDVEVVRVAVDHLAAQARRERLERARRALHRALEQRAPARVADVRSERRHHLDRADRVPLQDPVGGGVLEVAERTRDPPDELARCAQHHRGEVIEAPQLLARQERHEPHVVLAHPDDVVPVGAPDRDGHDLREPRGDVLHRPVLQVELLARERGVGDLEHEPPLRAGDEEVLVLLAAELARLPANPEPLGGDRDRLVGGQPRDAQLVPQERIGRRARSHPGEHTGAVLVGKGCEPLAPGWLGCADSDENDHL